jgi:hypothetical protein
MIEICGVWEGQVRGKCRVTKTRSYGGDEWKARNRKVEQSKNEGRAIVQAVGRRPVTAEARVRCRVSPCGIYGAQSGTGTGFSTNTPFSSVNMIPPVLRYLEKRKTNHLHWVAQ